MDKIKATVKAILPRPVFESKNERRDSFTETIFNKSPLGQSVLCDLCNTFNFDLLRPTRQPGDPETSKMRQIHTMTGDQLSSSCPFCQFLRGILQRSSLAVSAGLQIDLWRTDATHATPFFTMKKTVLSDVEFWQIGIQARLKEKGIYRLCDEFFTLSARSQEIAGRPPLYHGKVVDANFTDTDTVKMWLRVCEECHGADCRPIVADEIASKGFRVLDLEKQCLVDASMKDIRYVTLSYVWGRANVFVLTQAMLPKLKQPGSLTTYRQQLPRTIKDTISLCELIGERYVWIDSLCIVQDDHLDKRHQIGNMASVYAGSALTIIAAEGENSDAGLAGISYSRISQTSTWINGMELITVFNDRLKRDSIWNSRGWTFQETCLSHRKLYFTRHQMYYECGKMEVKEDQMLEENVLRRDPSPKEGERLSDHQLFWRNFRRACPTNSQNDVVRLINMYDNDLSAFLQRSLSFPNDILNAFTGIMEAYVPSLGPSFWGIPERMIHHSLTWGYKSPNAPLPRRRPGFPSWSWAGWTGSKLAVPSSVIHSASYPDIPAIFTVNQVVGGNSLPQIALKCIWTRRSNNEPLRPPEEEKMAVQHDRERMSARAELDRVQATGVDLTHILVFTTEHASLYISREPTHPHETYTILPADRMFDAQAREDKLPKIRADPTWRSSKPQTLDFIAIKQIGYGRLIRLALIEWIDGIAYRVSAQVIWVDEELWSGYKPERKTILLA